jgi:hypothetical protein
MRTVGGWLALLLGFSWSAPGIASAQALGGAGESCRARADCEPDLRCIHQVCVATEDEAGQAVLDETAAENAVGDDGGVERVAGRRWSDFELEGTHFFAGIVIGPGASGYWPYGGGVEVDGALLFSIVGGVLFGRTELSLEISPMTWVPDFDADPIFSLLVSVGGLVRLGSSDASWPLRFGLGLSAVNTWNDEVFMQGRLDLIGIVYRWGHLLFELDLPSIRFHSELERLGIWGWMFNIGVSYVI